MRSANVGRVWLGVFVDELSRGNCQRSCSCSWYGNLRGGSCENGVL